MEKNLIKKLNRKKGWIAIMLLSLFCALTCGIWLSSGAWFGDKDGMDSSVTMAAIEVDSNTSTSLKKVAYVAQRNQIILDDDVTFSASPISSEFFLRIGVLVTTDTATSQVAKDIIKFQNFVPTENDGYMWVRDGEWYYFCNTDGTPAVLSHRDSGRIFNFVGKESFVIPNGIRPQHYAENDKVNLEIRIEGVQARNIDSQNIAALAQFFPTSYPSGDFVVLFKDLNDNVLSTQTVKYAGDVTAATAPEIVGRAFKSWNTLKDGTGADVGGEEFFNISQNLTLYPRYQSDKVVVEVVQTANGEIAPGTTTANYGDDLSFVVKANGGYKISSITLGGASVAVTNENEQTVVVSNIVGDTVLTATYELKKYVISVESEGDGVTTPDQTQKVNYMDSVDFVCEANEGSYIASVLIDGVEQITNSDSDTQSYHFSIDNVSSDHKVMVRYEKIVLKITAKVNPYSDGYVYGKITLSQDTCVYATTVTYVVEAFDGARITSVKQNGYERFRDNSNKFEYIGGIVVRTDTQIEVSFEPSWTIASIGSKYYVTKYLGQDTAVTVPSKIYDPVTEASVSVYGVRDLGCDTISSLTISDGIEYVGNGGNNIFGGTKCSIETVVLPSSVTIIDSFAFLDCDHMTSIVMSESLVEIGDGAFQGCISMLSYDLPSTLSKIGEDAFQKNSSLKNLNFSSTIAPVLPAGNNFSGTDSDLLIRVPIGSKASYVSALSNCGFEEGTYMYAQTGDVPFAIYKDNIFRYIYFIDIINGVGGTSNPLAGRVEVFQTQRFEVTFTPDSGNRIEAIYLDASNQNELSVVEGEAQTYVFEDVQASHTIEAVYSKKYIQLDINSGTGSQPVIEYSDDMTKFRIADNVEPQATEAGKEFYYYSTVKTDSEQGQAGDRYDLGIWYDIPDLESVTVLYAIYLTPTQNYTTVQTYIVVPKNVTEIAGGTPRNMFGVSSTSTLRFITLSRYTTTIGDDALFGCSALAGISSSDNVTTIGVRAFSGSSLSGFTYKISPNLTSLGAGAFAGTEIAGFKGFEKLQITQIPSGFLDNATAITTIKLPASLEAIGNYAFYGSGIETIDMSGTKVSQIGDMAFDSSKIKNVTVSNALKTMNEHAFSNTSSLVSINGLETSVLEKIGDYCFTNSGIEAIRFPSTLTTIGSNAFTACLKLAAVWGFENTKVTKLALETFMNCEKLANISFPKTITSIEQGAFSYCRSLSSASGLGEATRFTTIGEKAFYMTESLRSIVLPASLTTIEQSAFNDSRIQKLNLSNCTSLVIVGASSFERSSLTEIDFPACNFQIGENAFKNCSSLEKVVFNHTAAPTLASTSFTGAPSTLVVQVPNGTLDGFAPANTTEPNLHNKGFADGTILKLIGSSKTAAICESGIFKKYLEITMNDAAYFFQDGVTYTIKVNEILPSQDLVTYTWENQDNSTTGSGNTFGAVGTYHVTATISGDFYAHSTASASLTLKRATLTGIEFNDQTYVYDGTEKTLAILGTLPVGATVSYTIDGVPGNSKTDAGEYAVVATFGGILSGKLTATLTIKKAPLNIVLSDKTVTYDGKEHGLEQPILPSGVVVMTSSGAGYEYTNTTHELDKSNRITKSSNPTTFTNAGEYTITQKFSGGKNYEDTSSSAMLFIRQAQLSSDIKFADNLNFTYDGLGHEFAPNGDYLTAIDYSWTDTDGGTGTGNSLVDAGTYTLTAVLKGDKNHLGKTIWTTIEGKKAEMQIDGDIVEQIFQYDGNNHTFALKNKLKHATKSTLQVEQPTVIYYLSGKEFSLADNTNSSSPTGTELSVRNCGTNGATATEAGWYTLTFVISAKNYLDLEITKANIFKINMSELSGIALNNKTHTYDGTEKTLAISGTLPAGAILSYTIDGESGNSKTDAGEYAVVATIQSKNYLTKTLSATLTIQKANLNLIFADNLTFTYDGTSHQIQPTNAIGVNINYSWTCVGGMQSSGTGNSLKNAGTYSLTATIADKNHTGTPKTITVTIKKAEATFDSNSIKLTVDYSGAAQSYKFTANIKGVNNEMFEASNYTVTYKTIAGHQYNNDGTLNTSNSLTSNSNSWTNAGVYFVEFVVTINSNYNSITHTPDSSNLLNANFIINRLEANCGLINTTVVYDGTSHTVDAFGFETVEFTCSLVGHAYSNSDKADALEATGVEYATYVYHSKTLASTTNAGVYTVSISFEKNNYNIEDKTATLIIQKSSLSHNILVSEKPYNGIAQAYSASTTFNDKNTGKAVRMQIDYTGIAGNEYNIDGTLSTSTVTKSGNSITEAGEYKVSYSVYETSDGKKFYNYSNNTFNPTSPNFIISRANLEFIQKEVSALSGTIFKNSLSYSSKAPKEESFTYSFSKGTQAAGIDESSGVINITSTIFDRTAEDERTISVYAKSKNFVEASFTLTFVPFCLDTTGTKITAYTSSFGTNGVSGGDVEFPSSITVNYITGGVVVSKVTKTITEISGTSKEGVLPKTTYNGNTVTFGAVTVRDGIKYITGAAFKGSKISSLSLPTSAEKPTNPSAEVLSESSCTHLILAGTQYPLAEGLQSCNIESVQLKQYFSTEFLFVDFLDGSGSKYVWRRNDLDFNNFSRSQEALSLFEKGYYKIYNQNGAVQVEIGTKSDFYPNLNSAITAAKGKTATLTLYQSQTVSAALDILLNSNITIKCTNDGYNFDFNIFRGAAEINLFNVTGGTLTFDDEHLFVDGKNDIFNGEDDTQNTSSLINVASGIFYLKNGTLWSNDTTYGGAVYVSGGTFYMYGGTISYCWATRGGGVDVTGGTFTLKGGEISNCSATRGGGVLMGFENASLNIEGGSIKQNNATCGAGISVLFGIFIMNGGEISNNSATDSGGGISIGITPYGAELPNHLVTAETAPTVRCYLNGGTISSNTADKNGGGVYAAYVNIFEFFSTIEQNTAECGGGLYIKFWDYGIKKYFTTSAVIAGTIKSNTATSAGGGVFIDEQSNMSMYSQTSDNGLYGCGLYVGYKDDKKTYKAEIYGNTGSGSLIYGKHIVGLNLQYNTNLKGEIYVDGSRNTSSKFPIFKSLDWKNETMKTITIVDYDRENNDISVLGGNDAEFKNSFTNSFIYNANIGLLYLARQY